MKRFIYIFSAPIFLFSCKDKKVDYQTNECKQQPAFLKKIGFDPARSAFTTNEKRLNGISIIQFNKPGDTSNGGRKLYRDSNWTKYGNMGPIQIDQQGNCFVAPVPVINLIDNPIALQNIVYKIDGNTGVMNSFVSLPVLDTLGVTNPYGIMGFAYLCETTTLYVSTVQGSTRTNERGILYAINVAGEIIDKIENIDAFGIGIAYVNDARKLFIGSARTPDIFEISLDEKGKFIGTKKPITTIANLGPRGDDKARKIRFDRNGNMEIYALEFNYNLTAPTEKQETKYLFSWNEEEKKWMNNK